jgi:hypothetical protein
VNDCAFSPETRLLLLAARPGMSENERQEIGALLRQPLDWVEIEAAAKFHLLEPLLFRVLADFTDVPGDVHRRLRQANIAGSARNLSLTAAASRLQSVLDGGSIENLALKGPILAVEAYGDIVGRWFTDVDVIVRRRDAVTAIDFLEHHGYRPVFPLRGRWQPRYVKRFYEIALVDPSGIAVDLHWSLLDSQFSICPTEGETWSAVRQVSVLHSELRTLSPGMTARYLCLHVAKHHWDRLGWLADIAHWAARHPEFDWNAQAEHPRAGVYVQMALALIERLLGRPMPAEVARRIESNPAVRLAVERIAQRLEAGTSRVTDRAQWRTDYVRLMPSAGDRWRSLTSTLFRPSVLEWMAVPLPPALAPLYAVIRPARLVWKRMAGHH